MATYFVVDGIGIGGSLDVDRERDKNDNDFTDTDSEVLLSAHGVYVTQVSNLNISYRRAVADRLFIGGFVNTGFERYDFGITNNISLVPRFGFEYGQSKNKDSDVVSSTSNVYFALSTRINFIMP